MDNSALFKIGYGLYVLTAKDGSKDNGCIVNTVMQVTDSPLVIALGVNKRNYTHDMIMKTKEFNVSVLDVNSKFSIFQNFGFQSGRDADKFADFKAVKRSENGLLYVTENTNAYISGKVLEAIDFGTHTLFKAEVSNAESLSNQDTLTYSDYHKHVKPAPKPAEKSGWRCKICGYVYEGDPLPADYICPICKHGAADFERITV
ncbi:flavin reductase [Aminipila luticellarii]|uniref:Flavin reductase n=1 Tax=Aminipila luticellarii TaxID=2507160 RepID=A0A410PS01_9FIRM|nr:flavin reductase [Aminipila luticellarii]QAT41771.1 flavin reductase [Aminipila luticellarii]